LGLVTILHPHHPLCGQQVPLVRIRRGGPDPDLIVRHPDGYHTAIAMSWTDFGAAPVMPTATPPPLLALTGLRHTVQFLDGLRQAGRWPLPATDVPPPPPVRYDQEVEQS